MNELRAVVAASPAPPRALPTAKIRLAEFLAGGASPPRLVPVQSFSMHTEAGSLGARAKFSAISLDTSRAARGPRHSSLTIGSRPNTHFMRPWMIFMPAGSTWKVDHGIVDRATFLAAFRDQRDIFANA